MDFFYFIKMVVALVGLTDLMLVGMSDIESANGLGPLLLNLVLGAGIGHYELPA